MEAMQSQTVDVIRRMKEITLVMQTPDQVLESQGVTPQDLEGIVSLSITSSGPRPLPAFSFPFPFCVILVSNLIPRTIEGAELNVFALLQICWTSYKSMSSLLTWPTVSLLIIYKYFLFSVLVSTLVTLYWSLLIFTVILRRRKRTC